MNLLVDKGVPLDTLIQQGLITPTCGLGTLSIEAARAVCSQTAAVSKQLRKLFALH